MADAKVLYPTQTSELNAQSSAVTLFWEFLEVWGDEIWVEEEGH